MKKIKFNSLEQDMYTFTLKNGLEVYLVPFENKNNFYAVLGTKYGSRDIEFKIDNSKEFIKTPYGIAHFLEHKIFEQEDGIDPFTFFSKSGVSCNASTTFTNTRYYIWGVNNLAQNLEYLINFVMTPYFTDESVEKEKGIIEEEILMYEDDPDWAIDDAMRKNIFYELPIREKIAGTITSIKEITKEDLYNCFNTFYVPSNMYLIVGGHFDKDEIEKLVLDNKIINQIPKRKKIERLEYKEPDDVKDEYRELHMNVTLPKMRYSVKINRDKLSGFSEVEIGMYLGIITSNLFGSSSKFREKVRKEKLTTGYYEEKNTFDNFITIDITAESEKADMLVDEINNVFDNISITEEELERIKKVWIASEIRMIDSVELTVDNMYSDLIQYGRVYENRVDLIKGLNIKDLNKLIDALDLSNKSLVFILPNNE